MDYIILILFCIWLLFGLVSFAMLLWDDKQNNYIHRQGDIMIELICSLITGPIFMVFILVSKYEEKRGENNND